MNLSTGDSLNAYEKCGVCLLCFAVLASTWCASGTRPEFLMPILAVSMLAGFFPMFFRPHFRGNKGGIALFMFFLLLIVGLCQPFNHWGVFHRNEFGSFVKPCAYLPFLPASVDAPFREGNAFSALARIVILTSVFAGARLVYSAPRALRYVLAFFCLNGVAMSVFAVLQKYCGVQAMYGVLYSASEMYGTFFLSNAAAAYLVLAMSANFAMSLECFRRGGVAFAALYFAGAAICGVGAWYSESTFGFVSALAVSLLFVLICFYCALKKLVGNVSVSAAITLVVASLCAAMSWGYAESVGAEKLISENGGYCDRMLFYRETAGVIAKAPVWGYGGDCLRYKLAPRIVELQKKSGKISYSAPVHAHSDVLELVAEYGVVGALFVAVALVSVLADALRNRRNFSAVNMVVVAGLFVFFAHSAFDMNMLVPSNVAAFALLLPVCFSRFDGKEPRR